MSATLFTGADRVSVCIDGMFGYDSWKILRDARNAALAAHLPLCLEVAGCRGVDTAGIGALLIAQDKVPHVELAGCPARFVEQFRAFGVCAHCAAGSAAGPGCPKLRVSH